MTQFGLLNIQLGWITIVLGILSGSILGMWAFAGPMRPPKGHQNYTDLPRRLTRLAHIAGFALPMISILYGQHIDLVPLSDQWKQIGSISWLICMWGVPLFLFLASIYLPFKYAEVVPVSCGTLALFIIAYGHWLQLTQ